MPTKRESEFIQCRHFGWLLSKRKGVWCADGRSNEINAGRHSLGTRDEDEARRVVHDLDEEMAMKLGKIERKAPMTKAGLTIPQAIKQYRTFKGRDIAVGGIEPETLKRYDRVLNKFLEFTARRHIRFMTEINAEMFDEYLSMLNELKFARSTKVTEMQLLISVHLFCIKNKLLDPRFGFEYLLKRNTQSLTFCPSSLSGKPLFWHGRNVRNSEFSHADRVNCFCSQVRRKLGRSRSFRGLQSVEIRGVRVLDGHLMRWQARHS